LSVFSPNNFTFEKSAIETIGCLSQASLKFKLTAAEIEKFLIEKVKDIPSDLLQSSTTVLPILQIAEYGSSLLIRNVDFWKVLCRFIRMRCEELTGKDIRRVLKVMGEIRISDPRMLERVCQTLETITGSLSVNDIISISESFKSLEFSISTDLAMKLSKRLITGSFLYSRNMKSSNRLALTGVTRNLCLGKTENILQIISS
jgi:hypothetical protein